MRHLVIYSSSHCHELEPAVFIDLWTIMKVIYTFSGFQRNYLLCVQQKPLTEWTTTSMNLLDKYRQNFIFRIQEHKDKKNLVLILHLYPCTWILWMSAVTLGWPQTVYLNLSTPTFHRTVGGSHNKLDGQCNFGTPHLLEWKAWLVLWI